MAKSNLSPEERLAKRRAAKREYDRNHYLATRTQKLEYQKQYANENKEKVQAYKREWKLTTKVERRPYNREWARRNRQENPERARVTRLAQARRWRQANLEKARAYNREQSKRWAKANLDIRRGQTAARRSRQSQHMPAWVDSQELYTVFKTCPPEMHVDHIIPFRGITADGYRISGLHVPWNLQYLTPFENISKNNRMRLEDHVAAEAPVEMPRQLHLFDD